MLDPDYFTYKADNVVKLYQDLEDFIIRDISMRLLTAGELSGTADRELYKLEQMGLHRDTVEKKIAEITGLSQKEVRAMLQDAVVTSYYDDKHIFDEMGIEVIKPTMSNAIKSVMDAELIRTNNELFNLTKTTMLQSSQDLIRLMDDAQFRVDMGITSYSNAICEVLDKYAKKGVVINYPSGTHRSIEAAVQCAMLTAMNQTAAQVTNQYIKEYAVEYVLVSAHTGARHDPKHPEGLQSHDWWQGKIYKINGSDEKYPNLLECTGYSIDEFGVGKVVNPLGLHGYNCRHSHTPAFEGMHNPYDDPQHKINLAESQEKFNNLQKQRAMERDIRSTKRAFMEKQQQVDLSTDDAAKAELETQRDKLAYELRQKNKAYNDFCEEHDLQKQGFRTKTVGFDGNMAAKANGRASAYNNNKTIESTIREKLRRGTFPTSDKEIQDILMNELSDFEMSAIPKYNPRIASAGKISIEYYPWGKFKRIKSIEIGKQYSGTREELIDSIMHEEFEARIAKTHSSDELHGMTDKEIHDIINRKIKEHFLLKGLDYERVGKVN